MQTVLTYIGNFSQGVGNQVSIRLLKILLEHRGVWKWLFKKQGKGQLHIQLKITSQLLIYTLYNCINTAIKLLIISIWIHTFSIKIWYKCYHSSFQKVPFFQAIKMARWPFIPICKDEKNTTKLVHFYNRLNGGRDAISKREILKNSGSQKPPGIRLIYKLEWRKLQLWG